jgi:DNA helicase HerA-like ATPase
MTEPLLIAKNDTTELHTLPQMTNRHGLITGATGTGKTATLQPLAQHFSSIRVPCFMSDVTGDLSGIVQPGGNNPKLAERVEKLKPEGFQYQGFPVTGSGTKAPLNHAVKTI